MLADVAQTLKSTLGVKHSSSVLTPSVFLLWLRKQLESAGVEFQRINAVQSLGELKLFGWVLHCSITYNINVDDYRKVIRGFSAIRDHAFISLLISPRPINLGRAV